MPTKTAAPGTGTETTPEAALDETTSAPPNGRRGGLLRRVLLVLVAIFIIDVLAFIVVPPFPKDQPGQPIAGIPDLIVVASMHQRKSQMADLSDAFITLPGGIGTLEGYFEILTWGQLGIHAKPSGILNVAGYFDRLIEFLDHAVREGFLTREHREMILVDSDPRKLLATLEKFAPRQEEKLMGRTHR